MKTAEQIAEKLWEKHAAEFSSRCNLMTEESFLLACREFGKEYGEAVRQNAVDRCRNIYAHQEIETKYAGLVGSVQEDITAAIERMELP